MAKKEEKVEKTTEEVVETPKAKKEQEIVVNDPQTLRPKELPLVITPAEGEEWKNEAQAEFAGTLNAYAYRNPEKWETKKETLLSQLREIGENPSNIVKYRGNIANVQYKNKLIEN